MQIPFFSKSVAIPFDMLQEHAEKVKECAWMFQQAMECYASGKCARFEEYRIDVDKLESEADTIKRNIRSAIPKKASMPVLKFQLFMYIREQDKVIDSVEDCLNWISYRPGSGIPEDLKRNFFDLFDAVVTPIEELSNMVAEARKYFDGYSEHQRQIVMNIIKNLGKSEHVADKREDVLKLDIFTKESDPAAIFHMVKLADLVGAIADHAENAGDMMRAMIAK